MEEERYNTFRLHEEQEFLLGRQWRNGDAADELAA